MAKKTAVLAVNPVNGYGLFQYLESFFENEIPYTLYAVADSIEIKTNSGVAVSAHDIISNLIGREDEYDALVFACGDAMPKFNDNISKKYNQDLLQVVASFGKKGKIMIGHCVAGFLFDIIGIAEGKKIALHPLCKPMVNKAVGTDETVMIDGKFYTAQTENSISGLIGEVVNVLK
ncbi:MAG: DJ-1/PfpI family protein [Rikenellaceae bacterium]|nr:DJ-1/PfpI family protein [Rikenellaceae bacterium]